MTDSKFKNSRIEIASINATIIGILIALVFGYSLYIKEFLNNAELRLISEAEKINQLSFIRSCYYPDQKINRMADNVRASVESERAKVSVFRAPELRRTQHSLPNSSEDIAELARYLHFLYDPTTPFYPEREGDYDIGIGKFIPNNSANRGEEILIVLNMMSHMDIFPDPPFETSAAFTKNPPRKLHFATIQNVEDWLEKVDAFVVAYKELLYFQFFLPSSKWIDDLKARDHKLIKKWESSRFLITFGHLDPDLIIQDFHATAKKVINVSDSTHYELNRLKKLSTQYPSQKIIGLFLFLLAIALGLGVVEPLIFQRTPEFVYKSIPMYLSIIAYIVIAIWIIFF